MNSLALVGSTPTLSRLYGAVPSIDGADVGVSGAARALVVLEDRAVPYLSQKLELFYPKHIAEQLIRKDTMPKLLGRYGFPELKTVRVKRVDDIKLNNFILKPVFGSACGSWVAVNQSVAYKKFDDPTHLEDTLAGSPDIKWFVAQEAVMADAHTTASVAGTVNQNGDVLFIRPTLSYWRNGVRYKSVRSFAFQELYTTQELLREFIASAGIRCAAFSLQLILKDEVFYPMDWNFHLPAPYVMDATRLQREEFDAAVHHMMGYTARFDLPTDKWVINRSEATNALHVDAYMANKVAIE